VGSGRCAVCVRPQAAAWAAPNEQLVLGSVLYHPKRGKGTVVLIDAYDMRDKPFTIVFENDDERHSCTNAKPPLTHKRTHARTRRPFREPSGLPAHCSVVRRGHRASVRDSVGTLHCGRRRR